MSQLRPTGQIFSRLFVGTAFNIQIPAVHFKINHIFHLSFLLHRDNSNLMGPMDQVWIGSASKNPALLVQHCLEVIHHLIIICHPGWDFNSDKIWVLIISAYIQVEKM
jgi:hypothetical protein